MLGEEEVARDHNGDVLINGFFDVTKPVKKPGDFQKHRGITDRRPANAYEEKIDGEPLPHGSQLGLIVLKPDQGFRGNFEDLSNMFCAMGVMPVTPAWLTPMWPGPPPPTASNTFLAHSNVAWSTASRCQ